MYRRACAIALRDGAPDAEVAALVRALREAPRHIPTMRTSTVAREVTPHHAWDLLWENAFDDEEGYEAYVSHPYHCNVIDTYMYREHPGNVVREIYCLRWDESSPLPAGVEPEQR